MEDIKNIIESLLFVAQEPLTVDMLRRIIPQAESKEIRNALQALSTEYDSRKGGFYVREVAGGYQIRTRPEYTQWVRRLIQPNPPRLSKPALETLAIIAYKQPIIRADVEHIRGVDCGGVLRVLLERKFIRVLGRKEIPGRPLIYATTKHFLEVFDLKDLKDLPSPKEIEELGRSRADETAETLLGDVQADEASLQGDHASDVAETVDAIETAAAESAKAEAELGDAQALEPIADEAQASIEKFEAVESSTDTTPATDHSSDDAQISEPSPDETAPSKPID